MCKISDMYIPVMVVEILGFKLKNNDNDKDKEIDFSPYLPG